MMPITAALVLSSKNLWEQAHACIQNLPVRIALEQTEEIGTEALLDRLERHRVDAVLVEAGELTIPLEEFIRRLRNTATQPAVFVLHSGASPNLILEALRAGAAEFLYPPLQETLHKAFEKLSASRSKAGVAGTGGLGKIFGFLSAKGGCGATSLACHVAADVARTLNQKVLLADMDFDAGLIRFVMKAKTTYSVRDAIDNLHRMDASYWKALVSSHPNQLDIIPAPDEIAVKQCATAEEMVHMMRFIRSTYPAAIVDFGRNISAAAIDALPELESLYLVTTPDLTALTHSQRALQMMQGHSLKVLLNRVPERGAPDLQSFERLLGRPASAVFVDDYVSLYDAYSEGQLLDASTRLGREIRAFAASLTKRIHGEEENQVKSTQRQPAEMKKWFSFRSRSAI